VVIRGRAKKPVFLFVKDGQIEIRDAAQFWGKSTGETCGALRQELEDREIKTLQIGPAGEKLVRFATVITDRQTSTGRTGLGAVLGSKNIKAIACRGKGDIEVKFPEKILKLGPNLTVDNRGDEKRILADESVFFSSETIKAIEAIAIDDGLEAETAHVMLRWGSVLFEKGIIDRRHTRGLVLDRRNTESLTTLARNISLGKNFGHILGQGPLRVAVKFGFDPVEWLVSAESLLEIYSDSETDGCSSKVNTDSELAGRWKMPEAPGEVSLTGLYDLISGCLGVVCSPGIEKDSVSKVFGDISEVLRINTGLTFGMDALLAIAYRCYALERLFNSSVESAFRKQNQSDLHLDVPAPFYRPVDLVQAKELRKLRLNIDRHYRLNGWGRSKLIQKKVFGLLDIGDLWAVLRK